MPIGFSLRASTLHKGTDVMAEPNAPLLDRMALPEDGVGSHDPVMSFAA